MANDADQPNRRDATDARPVTDGTDAVSNAARPSPLSSRQTSPARKQNSGNPSTSSIPRHASTNPSRPLTLTGTGIPSPASRTASTTGNDAQRQQSVNAPRTQTSSAVTSPSASVPPSPRIKSPTPEPSRRSSASSSRLSDSESAEHSRQTSQTASSKSVEGSDRSPSPTHTSAQPPPQKSARAPGGRAPKLETVEEGDHSASPREPSTLVKRAEEEEASTARAKAESDVAPKRTPTSQQIAASIPNEQKPAQPDSATRKRSNSSLVTPKSRTNANDGSSRMMTVETETVSTIPQTAISSNIDRASSGRGDGSSVRVKPSQDGTRSKKDKKKAVKKPSSTAGSSKADIFEAKVASEIEGGDSDSDETFVYESNPAETRTRNRRNHSRTPSNASAHTITDRKATGQRGASQFHSDDTPVRPKRSMKFASGGYMGSVDDDTSERDAGTVRRNPIRANMAREMHDRRLRRNEGTVDSATDNDSPFSQASKLRVATGLGSRASLKSNSPGSTTPTRLRTPVKKGPSDLEYDSGNGLDERAPLLDPLRTPKARSTRYARHSQLDDLEYYGEERPRWLRRTMGYVLMTLLILVTVSMGGGMLYLWARPLYDVSVQEIRNVLASEQEIMLDLVVEATNPNIAPITVRNMDVNIFAKSRHVSDNGLHSGHVWARDGIDEGTDPIEDPDSDHQTMLLGRIFRFDSALQFEPSPLRRHAQRSTGELRLARPGNRTETGGSARWERVLEHEFVLIVRGVLKYELPLSAEQHTASVGARALVKPEEGVDASGSLVVVQLDHLPPMDGVDYMLSGAGPALRIHDR